MLQKEQVALANLALSDSSRPQNAPLHNVVGVPTTQQKQQSYHANHFPKNIAAKTYAVKLGLIAPCYTKRA